jgi:hypothetical protein
VCREACQGIPALVLIDVEVFPVLDWVNKSAGLEVRPAPAARVRPGGPVVAQRPHYTTGTSLHLHSAHRIKKGMLHNLSHYLNTNSTKKSGIFILHTQLSVYHPLFVYFLCSQSRKKDSQHS